MEIEDNYDRESELKAFDDTKAGVKGLVDSGIRKIPRIFYQTFDQNYADKSSVRIPIIDLAGVEKDSVRRKEVVNEVRDATQTWGFFQVVNHGVPQSVVDEILECTRRFFEQDTEVKKEFFTREPSRSVQYNSSFDLFRVKSATWRDSLFCSMVPTPNPNDLPIVFREILFEYSKHVSKLGLVLFELLSEALGLNRDFLRELGCADGHCFISHYSPPCPEPDLTLCTKKHSDGFILTVLLQDLVGGLQFLHHNQWVDVDPTPGAFVVNIGDLLQVMSNDKFISVEHRVLASHRGPRVSVACFFRTKLSDDEFSSKPFGPIKELLTEDDPSKYREMTMKEFISYYNTKIPNGPSAMVNFRL